MNSRMKRKIAAKEHNDRIHLMNEIKGLRSKIYAKHRVNVMVTFDHTNESVITEIDRLKGILNCDTPPRKVVNSGGREFARMHLAAIAAMAGIGHVNG